MKTYIDFINDNRKYVNHLAENHIEMFKDKLIKTSQFSELRKPINDIESVQKLEEFLKCIPHARVPEPR